MTRTIRVLGSLMEFDQNAVPALHDCDAEPVGERLARCFAALGSVGMSRADPFFRADLVQIVRHHARDLGVETVESRGAGQ